jgi:hypothetical protein
MAESETLSKVVREWITGLLIPAAIFVYTYQKERSDEQSRALDRVSTIIKSLGSTSAEERSLARSYIEYLADTVRCHPKYLDCCPLILRRRQLRQSQPRPLRLSQTLSKRREGRRPAPT